MKTGQTKDDSERFFRVKHRDAQCSARLGALHTEHGDAPTPAFMPVGTQGTVKAMTPEEVAEIGAAIILCNTYHLYLRPGAELIRKAGGLHRFMHWNGTILTDSGGFQVHSLSHLKKVTEEGVLFRSHIDGSLHLFTPEISIKVQEELGSDLIMPLDICLPYPSPTKQLESAVVRTTRWAERAQEFHADKPGFLFGIIQGGTSLDLRKQSLAELEHLDFAGLAIGGLSVGENKQEMVEVLTGFMAEMPEKKPHYLMGMSAPLALLDCVGLGIDLFDCVLPTRLGRNGTVYCAQGKINIDNACFREDFGPIDSRCDCYVCRHYSRAYLRHLFIAKEMLAGRLMSYHNLRFMERLMEQTRQAILTDRFLEFQRSFATIYQEKSINQTEGMG
ncbi:MAG: tRNA guanosine(34) transglycosylase Tgt [Coprothermobacterota bacterium]|nr:tRNA guanosine(34) transglycosylase Tgt [Coprothermobacterota bacterium]